MGTHGVRAPVWRITVDERLDDHLIRVLRCRLVEGVNEFWDRADEWGREYELLVTPEDYLRKLCIPADADLPWDALTEGQVYLVGEFAPVRPEDAAPSAEPTRFRLEPSRANLLRVDQITGFRDGLRTIYTTVLRGR